MTVCADTRFPAARRTHCFGLWLAIALINAFVIGVVTSMVMQNRERAFVEAEAIADNYSRTLEANLLGFFRRIDVTLLNTADEVSHQRASGGIRERELNRFLARQDKHIPEARGLRVVDEQGFIRYAVSGINTARANLRDRPYFIRVRDDPNAGLVFSDPVMGRASNMPVITLSRRIEDAGGVFAGEVNAAIALDRFTDMLALLDLGPHGAASLWNQTQLIARYTKDPSPATAAKPGMPIPSPELQAAITAGEKTASLHIATRIDEVQRSYRVRRVGDYPLYLVIGLADVDFLAQWRRDSLRTAALAAAFVLGTLVFGALAHVSLHRREAAEFEIQRLNAELEQRVAERTAQLESASKDLEEFSYAASHDLITPLRAISGFARILQVDYGPKLDAEGQRLIRVIQDTGLRMGRLLDGILEYLQVGRQRLVLGATDMASLAQEVFAQVAPLDRRVEFRVAELPQAWVDPSLIRSLLVKLFSNAIRFSVATPEAAVEVGAMAGDDQNTYFVRDNGVGFDMQFSAKLFRVFERLHSAPELMGTGIGLAIVKRIVERHGGRVWAESQVGGGATFYFTLPKVPQ